MSTNCEQCDWKAYALGELDLSARREAEAHAAAGARIIIAEPIPFPDRTALRDPAFRRIRRERPVVFISSLRKGATRS